ncbi:helix-turn-helix transcriptional regulator [Streptomyces sp. KN37]|uniref:helix-turn-helix domain-containing protein n=1 Tax=Streptomyces sp. KN37 TaxID=3090667 RepID=UPI002A7539DF|nr:helix-turn-helix transcriptional regulator [Streptomyces sp. KN37]WPO73969.1 helix-turn-helix transcriptional regulator [Streptomyces sp. KN37]
MRPHPSAIRYRREALKMSLAQLSALTGIDKGHLSRVETGKAGLGDDYICRVAKALDATPADITHKENP